jgi:hypothetical protein
LVFVPDVTLRRRLQHPRVATATGLAAVLLAALAFSFARWGGDIHWSTDAMFYQAQTLELRGESAESARRAVFQSPITARLIQAMQASDWKQPDVILREMSNPRWVSFSAQFYRRRWTVPVLAAALYPIEHERSLLVISLLGYVAIPVLLFFLLRRRFGAATAVGVSIIAASLPSLRWASFSPLTDSWGIALEIATLLTAMVALERGKRWVPLWVLSILALAFTRNLTVIPLTAVAVVALRERSRIAALVLGSGVVAAMTPLLLFGASYSNVIRYQAGYSQLPLDHNSLAHDYWLSVTRMVNGDYLYLRHHKPIAVLALIALAALLALNLRVPPRVAMSRTLGDRFPLVVLGFLLGSVAFLLLDPQFNEFRFELVMIPPLAVGLAAATTWARALGGRGLARLGHPKFPGSAQGSDGTQYSGSHGAED